MATQRNIESNFVDPKRFGAVTPADRATADKNWASAVGPERISGIGGGRAFGEK